MHNEIPDKNILQAYPASCAIKCQQIILRDYGIDVSEKDLCRVAKENGWYDENIGVYMHDNGKLLEGFGISYHHSQYNSLCKMKEEIGKEHRVIVNVNRMKLDGYRETNTASHAIIVTALDSNYVYVINPANGIMNDRYEVDVFMSAWGDSCYYLLATDEPALLRYAIISEQM